MMLDAEVEVHRDLIAVLMARGSQKPDPLKTTSQIHLMTADRANTKLAAMADLYPRYATLFPQMLDQWKKARQI